MCQDQALAILMFVRGFWVNDLNVDSETVNEDLVADLSEKREVELLIEILKLETRVVHFLLFSEK